MKKKIPATDTRTARSKQRRTLIIQAARGCFLKFGFAKTSLDDIANAAHISRPLIYQHFANKEDLFAAVLEETIVGTYPAADEALATSLPPREKLLALYKALILDPWEDFMTQPMAADFYETCDRLAPEIEISNRKRRLRYTQQIIPLRALAEIFMFAVEGIQGDLPNTRTLKQRLQLLIDQFVPE